jgi:uncharacterized protein YdeI (YjbR/CyaY-like superfamily)
MPALESLELTSQKAWEGWLKAHHDQPEGVWLVFERRSTTFNHAMALESALCYGWIDGQTQSISDVMWKQRFTPRSARSIWSKINCAKALELVESGRMRPPGQAEIDRARLDGRWDRAYDGQKKSVVPDDLAEALRVSPVAKAFFDSLNSKNRYAILFRLQTAKKAETRARRLRLFVGMLEEGKTLH